MAYKFDNATSNRITTPSALTAGASRSIAVRFKPNSFSGSASSSLYTYGDTDTGGMIHFLGSGTGKTVRMFYVDTVFGQVLVDWASAFNAGEVHTVVGTINVATFDSAIYADADASAKNVANAGGFNGYNLGGSSPLQTIGNYVTGNSLAFLGIIYEVAVWDGTVLAGSQAAIFGAGYDAEFLTPKPTYHWRLVGTEQELHTGAVMTVSGATVVAHDARIYYPAPPQIRRWTTPVGAPTTALSQLEGPKGAWRGSWRGVARGMTG